MNDQVRVRRARVTGLRSRDSVRHLLGRLELVRWPSTDPRRIVVIRHLAVRTDPGSIEASLARALAEAVSGAWPLNPAQVPPASAEAVCWEHAALQLACLACDCATGQIRDATRWWWPALGVRFLGTPAATLAGAWSREPRALPAVIAELARAGRLPHVWRALDTGSAAHVLETLAVDQPALRALQQVDPGRTRADVDLQPHASAVWPERQRARWQPILVSLAADDPRALLAGVLAAFEAAPACLSDVVPTRLAAWLAAAPTRPSAAADGSRTSSRSPNTPPTAGPLPSPLAHSSGAVAQNVVEPAAAVARVAAGGARLRAEHASTIIDALVATDFGGCAFVLNAMAHASLRSLWQGSAEPLHGFACWRRICLDLGLPVTDPLAIALQRLLDDLAVVPEPTPEALARFGAGVRDVYGDVWSSTLVRISGTLSITPTHVDFWLPSESIRLDVRRAGLDVDPAYLSWLGRVVRIHYVARSEVVC